MWLVVGRACKCILSLTFSGIPGENGRIRGTQAAERGKTLTILILSGTPSHLMLAYFLPPCPPSLPPSPPLSLSLPHNHSHTRTHMYTHTLPPSLSQDYEVKLGELESALVREMQAERTASVENIEKERTVGSSFTLPLLLLPSYPPHFFSFSQILLFSHISLHFPSLPPTTLPIPPLLPPPPLPPPPPPPPCYHHEN